MENLYTIIVEYLGGTYIFQREASSEAEALTTRAAVDDDPSVEDALPTEATKALRGELARGGQITALSEVKNIWCATAIAKGQLVLVHVIATVPYR